MIDFFLNWSKKTLAIVIDNAYGIVRIRREIDDNSALPLIPTKENARKPIPHDASLYAKCNLVERFFCRMTNRMGADYPSRRVRRNFLNMVPIFRNQILGQLSPNPSTCSSATKNKAAWYTGLIFENRLILICTFKHYD